MVPPLCKSSPFWFFHPPQVSKRGPPLKWCLLLSPFLSRRKTNVPALGAGGRKLLTYPADSPATSTLHREKPYRPATAVHSGRERQLPGLAMQRSCVLQPFRSLGEKNTPGSNTAQRLVELNPSPPERSFVSFGCKPFFSPCLSNRRIP